MPTALYRRYRPETYADVIGQEHVTEPLMQALRTGRVNHAYLFSGPHGCGKTTSARILARCLNCEQGPTPTPCGECDSCVGLSRGGAGTVDVIEIDAASHGGVDDARDLREKASFGPAYSRYKVYIIDEAHMVTSAGFNALLKIVEEPPEHVVFVFATTAPEKVIGTIRSRTHHYPFRLVPPARLQEYLAQMCEAEGVPVEKGVLPLVVRAGGGSVRDSLSVLDQLIAGSDQGGLTYAGAIALLGYTDAALLDDVVEAFAAGDGGAVFRVVDQVVESGHEPRRFVEDLLERLRDLLVISAVPDGAHTILRGLPEDQLERMRQQASRFGSAQLTRAADVVNAGLTELTGATSPRLQLELICARVLLPGAEGEQGYAARLDRMERRLGAGAMSSDALGEAGGVGAAREATRPVGARASSAAGGVGTSGAGERPQASGSSGAARDAGAHGSTAGAAARPSTVETGAGEPPTGDASAHRGDSMGRGAADERARHADGRQQDDAATAGSRSPAVPAWAEDAPRPTHLAESPVTPAAGVADHALTRAGAPGQPRPAPQHEEPSASRGPGGVDVATIRRVWPDVVERLAGMRRVTWMMVRDHATVASFDGRRLVLALGNPGVLASFRSGAHGEFVQQALIDVLGVEAHVDVIGGDAAPESRGESGAGAGDVRAGGDWSAQRAHEERGGTGAGPGGVRAGGERTSQPVTDDDVVGSSSAVDGSSPRAPGAPEPAGWADAAPEPEPEGWDAPRSAPTSASSSAAASTSPRGDRASASSQEAPGSVSGRSPGGRPSGGRSSGGRSDRSSEWDRGPEGPSAELTAAQQPRRSEGGRPAMDATPTHQRVAPAMDEPSPDDVDAEDSGLVGRAVVEQLLGGRVIDETEA